jgi:PAS domain S-box-containing protein
VFGRPIGDLVVEDPLRAGDATGLTRAGLWQGRVEVLRPDGARVAVLGRSIVIAGEDEPMHLLVLADRPSDPVADALAAGEQRLAAIVDSATDAIVSMDRTHRIVIFNTAAQEMFACAAADAIGKPFERFIAEPHRAAYREYLAAFAADEGGDRRVGVLPRELTAVRADGKGFPVDATISRVDGPDGPFTVIVETSERRRAEAGGRAARARAARMTRIGSGARKLQALATPLSQLSLDDLFRSCSHGSGASTDSATVLLWTRRCCTSATDGLRRDADDMHDVRSAKGRGSDRGRGPPARDR